MTRGSATTSMQARQRPLREEIASAAIQGTAAAASAAGLVHLLARPGAALDAVGTAALIVYGASMAVAFLASALYHGIRHARIKATFRTLDHCTIFVFIAGVYTPVTLLPLRDHGGAFLLVAIWSLALVGIALRLGNGALYRRVAVPLYLAMGWLGFAWGMPLYEEVGSTPILLMFAGGLCYTGGLVFYGWRRLPFSNPAWHLCVVAGSVCFFLAVADFTRAP